MNARQHEKLREELFDRAGDAKAGSCLEALWRAFQAYDEVTTHVVESAIREVEADDAKKSH